MASNADGSVTFAANQREYDCGNIRHAEVQFSNADACCADC